jgi:outer membrane biosynthesis protein TonB
MPSNRRARIDTKEKLAVVSVDRVFIEGERNTYASRGVALIVLLNGIGAMVLLALLAQNLPSPNNVEALADAMMVFSAGAILGLTSAFIAYLNRTIRLEWPEFTTWRRPLRWLAVAAAILGAACFLVGMNMARISIEAASSSTIRSKTISPQPPQTQPIEPQPAEPGATEPPAPQTEPQPPEPIEPQLPESQETQPPAPQTEPQPPEPIEPQPQQEPNEPQTTEPPTTEPVEPQQTGPQQL